MAYPPVLLVQWLPLSCPWPPHRPSSVVPLPLTCHLRLAGQYASAIIRANGNKIGAYASVGSQAGIIGFIFGNYLIAASDAPLDNILDPPAGGTGKFTIPLTLATYSFVTKKAAGLKLTGSQLAGIYLGRITKWSQIKKGLSGNIIPVARADGSGLIGEFFRAEVGSSWPFAATGTASWSSVSGVAGNIVYKAGSGGVAGYAAANVNAITYVQSGIGITQYKLKGIYVKNIAGQYVLATTADPQQSIPRSLPPSNANWGGVSLLRMSGRKTYPIASFVYMFAKAKYGSSSQGSTVKAFLIFTQGNIAQNLARTYFFRLPSDVVKKNVAAIKLIK